MGSGGIRVDDGGHGAVSLSWADLIAALDGQPGSALAERIGSAVEVLGVRCVDADGREVSDALDGCTFLVGFRSPASI